MDVIFIPYLRFSVLADKIYSNTPVRKALIYVLSATGTYTGGRDARAPVVIGFHCDVG